MSWFEILKVTPYDENWLADAGTDNTGLPAITPVTAQLPERATPPKCPRGQVWCVQHGMCETPEERARKHPNEGGQ